VFHIYLLEIIYCFDLLLSLSTSVHQIVKTQTMRGSPFIKPVETECKAWERKLQYAQHLVDEWVTCQRTW
jgi:hypothetical protein